MEKGIWYNMEVESGIIESGITESGITLSFKLWDGQIIRLAWHNLGDLAPSASIKSVMILSVVITCTILLTARVRGLGIIFTSGQHKLDQARLRAAKHQPYLNKLGVRQIKRETPVKGLGLPSSYSILTSLISSLLYLIPLCQIPL